MVLLYVSAVFIGFILLAFFAFNSIEAVQALLVAWLGALGATIPSVLGRIEYRLTEAGLEKRRRSREQPKEFKRAFAWEELSHLVPIKTGYKFYKDLPSSGSVSRFVRTHLSDAFSGEFHVEAEDQGPVQAIIERHGIPTSKPSVPPSLPKQPKRHG